MGTPVLTLLFGPEVLSLLPLSLPPTLLFCGLFKASFHSCGDLDFLRTVLALPFPVDPIVIVTLLGAFCCLALLSCHTVLQTPSCVVPSVTSREAGGD